MLTAREANRRYHEKHDPIIECETKQIMDEVEYAVDNGDYYCELDVEHYFDDETINGFVGLGYRITSTDHCEYSGITYMFYWDDESLESPGYTMKYDDSMDYTR